MSYQVYLLVPFHEHIDTFETLDEALQLIRESWNEEAGEQLFAVQDEQGNIICTLMRGHGDPEVCVTTFPDGRNGYVELHRCHYVLTDEGRYDHTQITAL